MTAKTRKSPARPRQDPADDELARYCKALGHPARVRILRFLIAQNSCFFGNLSEVVPLSPSTVSQHLAVLQAAGLIRGSADATRGNYCVDPEGLAKLRRLIGKAFPEA